MLRGTKGGTADGVPDGAPDGPSCREEGVATVTDFGKEEEVAPVRSEQREGSSNRT
ncbi:MAG: hypothetical protein OXF02_04835 [Simkaniaceae bacterium]|nr:hypothetical protein [Simkaniaceae bacterium]